MRVTVSGPPGSGTTTLAEALSSRFDLEHVSSGDVFRAMARERGVSLAEFGRIAEEDPEIDREIDERQREIARDRDGVVMEGRLSGWMVDEATLRVWLTAPVDVRAERVAEREEQTVEGARAEIEDRENSEAKRYREIHGIDIDDLSVYDLVIDTSRWDEDGVAKIATTAVGNL
ncbi:AAA family ATPase [Haladaptatus sp. F3-133]|jgi:cytidylate kinase|uniref:Cytidylate kinase n=1 Tax=Halorutilus salinus TaxID=2487751 RepID=A0A9Q4C3P0_9EURY|nr:AAA family ATPase [Halorutilus salinus]MCX2817756.1 AAA family ATPase [Halorutilus salinus]